MLVNIDLIFDTGCLVLIWLVQLVIYPSFSQYSRNDLIVWHQKYTKRITIVVLPLMVGQLFSTGLLVYAQADYLNVMKMLLVLGTWITTFSIFVPLHANINPDNSQLKETVGSLIHKNWIRTILWTLIFITNFF